MSRTSTPFVLQVAAGSPISPTPAPGFNEGGELRYDAGLGRNRVSVDGLWVDVAAAARTPAGKAALAAMAGTVCQPPGSPNGGYKVDD